MPEMVMSVDGKITGSIDGDVYTKRVHGNTHMLRKPPAWAIDCKAFVEQIVGRTNTIRIEDLDSGITYEISTAIFDRHKVWFKRKFGEQYFVTLHHWHQMGKEQPALL